MAFTKVSMLLLLLSAALSNAALIPMRGWNIRPQLMPRVHSFDHINLDQDILNAFSTSSRDVRPPPPRIKSLHIVSQIANRYANTVMTSRVANPANISQEVSFSVIIPETAFISGFQMQVKVNVKYRCRKLDMSRDLVGIRYYDNIRREIAGKVYKAYVKEKEEAKREYAEAVHRGQAAAHVHQSARDSERFSVSVNVEAQSKVTFTLTYEELLQRELGVYRHVININPGQIVPDLKVDVHIKEPRNITELHAKEIQSANEIDPEVGDNPKAQVEWIQPNEAKIHFDADEKEQRRIEKLRKEGKEDSGLAGKFVIDYDVDRDPTGNEVIVSDGYFVHFFAPKDLPAMRKHVLFVLDVSGSMVGRKIEQLQQAMLSILDQLKPEDHFNIIEFSYSVTVRNLDAEVNSAVYTPYSMYYPLEEPKAPQILENTETFPATPYYVNKAKAIIRKMTAGGGTNIYDALQTAIKIAKNGISNTTRAQDKQELNGQPLAKEESHRPIIVFLTDGEPTVGETSLYKIQNAVNELNSDPKSTIFSLAFGEGADFDFLKKISLANNGFARHIYEAADAEIQIKNFYNHISSPLLADVKFIYSPDQVDSHTVTKRIFKDLFKGSEIVIAGKIGSAFNSTKIEAIALDGPKLYDVAIPETKSKGFGSLERLWAYITIRQLLDEDAIQSTKQNRYSYEEDGPTTPKPNATKPTPKESALKIALKYSFVCPLTSLVVVKPNGTTNDLNTESASPGANDSPIAPMAFQQAVLRSGIQKYMQPMQKHMPAIQITKDNALRMPPMTAQADFSNRMDMPGGGQALFAAFGQPMPQSFSFHKVASGLGPLNYMPMPAMASYPSRPPPNFYPSTPIATTLNVPQPEYDRVDMESDEEVTTETALPPIPWLIDTRNGDQITLNTTQGMRTFNLPSAQNASEEACRVNDVAGKCQPLIHSKIEDIPDDLDTYTNEYLCELPGQVAGVCVPDVKRKSDVPAESSTQTDITDVATQEATTDEPTTEVSDEPTADDSVTEENEDVTREATEASTTVETETELSP